MAYCNADEQIDNALKSETPAEVCEYVTRIGYDTRGEAETAREQATHAGEVAGRIVHALYRKGLLTHDEAVEILRGY